MPKYPAFLARRFESRGVPCTVDEVEDLSPRFRRVRLSGAGLRGHEWQPCQVTSFRVSDTEFRHYTPDGYDADTGRMSVLFHRHTEGHGDTPGETWLSGLGPRSTVLPVLPGAGKRFRAAATDGTYLVFGDATTVGLWHSLIHWLPAGARVGGAVELPAADVELGAELMPGIDVLAGGVEPGAALDTWLAARDDLGHPDHVYLSGHAQSIQRLRAVLRERFGVDRRAIHSQPYWATGKAGL